MINTENLPRTTYEIAISHSEAARNNLNWNGASLSNISQPNLWWAMPVSSQLQQLFYSGGQKVWCSLWLPARGMAYSLL